MFPHWFIEASLLNEKGSEAGSMCSACFKWQQSQSSLVWLHITAQLMHTYIDFFIRSVLAPKNSACALIWSSTKSGLAPISKWYGEWNEIFICVIRRCAYGGTGNGLSIMNCWFNRTMRSTRSTFNWWSGSTRLYKRKDLIDSIELFCYTATPAFIQTHGWEVLLHSSSDLASTNFHFVRSLSNAVCGIYWILMQNWELRLMNFSSYQGDYYHRCIEHFNERWE